MTSRLAALAGALVLALAGCGGGEDDPAEQLPDVPTPVPQATETVTGEPTDTATETATGTAGGEVTVEVASTELGEVLVDGDGMVLYVFDNDMQGESVCYDQCEQAWPPLVSDGEVTAGEDVDDAMFGSVERQDGSQQVTYNDWPLYYFAQDAAPGDTNGQALNDVWWVVDPSGEPIRE
jgi:predicted lipoprotein with Yx(FWY)xxD motif